MIQEQVVRQGLKEETRRKKVFKVTDSRDKSEINIETQTHAFDNSVLKLDESQGDETEPPLPVVSV